MKIVCISAKARHGKDTSAEILKELLEQDKKRVLIVHYADLLKFMCTKYFGWDGNKDSHGRSLLQYIGTNTIGKKQPGYWVNFVVSVLKFFPDEWDYVLIPDCRFPIEYETMKAEFDTILLRVTRPNFDNELSDEQRQHASETALDDYQYDYEILNDDSLDVLKNRLKIFTKLYLN